MRRLLAVAIALVAATAIAGTVFATGGPDGTTLAVELDEWGLATSSGRVEAGSIDLTLRNTGRVEHELLVVRTPVAPDEIPVGLEGVKPSLAGTVVLGAEHSHHGGESGSRAGSDHLAPGETRRSGVELSAGHYVLLCGINGHYAAGQRAALTVE